MPQTDHFYHLEHRKAELKKALLPKSVSPTGNYRRSTYEKVSAYILLIHAEIEYYLEGLARDIAKKSYLDWIHNSKTNVTLVSLVAFSSCSFKSIPESATNLDEDLKYRIRKAHSVYNEYIRTKNHGIKEKNILELFLPIGVEISQIDNSLLIALENFGRERGQIAHTTRAQQPLSPTDAENEVNQLLALLKDFDLYIKRNFAV